MQRMSKDLSKERLPLPEFVPSAARLLAITPFEIPDLPLARILCKHDVASAIDIGRDATLWPDLLHKVTQEHLAGLGLRIPDGVVVDGLELPKSVQFLIVAEQVDLPSSWLAVPRLAQVCSVEAAQDAVENGALGLIAKGQESGGLSGAESSFVLLQRLVEWVGNREIPVWCQGGIGLHTAAAAFAGGATGIVLDAVLAPFAESSLGPELKKRILDLDGSEVRCLSGYQVLTKKHLQSSVLDHLTVEDVRAGLLETGEDQLLAIGQDAALARAVSAKCSSIEVLINTLRTRIAGQLHQAQSLSVFAEGNAWATSHGTRYPIAQGPMTRVSDTAAFSAAVADAGGLPFTALSLMNEASSRDLLEATRQQVGDQPWGVGVLGFADRAILDPQLALIREFKPSVLLLAGGRPSQARPFIEMGIATYLHVPSPGLLDLFLKEGATHFVFEGRECGGHVGPRYSFVLWEQVLHYLTEYEHPERLHILFAGGIHDARSSAMVAAIAAPLAARGAKVGILMGTAYIATAEAVSAGAVLADFQSRALAGSTTALVETAPGHAIRCIPSGFMTLFANEKSRLQQQGVDQKQAWKQLEDLTVGRLRIATKGVDRVNGQLVAVSSQIQSDEGMYMIGQVIAMKSAVTTIAELHQEVTTGAVAYLNALTPPELIPAHQAEPIAIVGMACLYPGSPDLESYWENILSERDLVTEVPEERWSVSQYYRGANAPADKSVSKWGGFIPDTPFDPLKFGIPPASLAAIEPVQLLSLEVAGQALRDAGYEQRWFDREKTSVIFGAEAGMDLSSQYTFRNLWQQYGGDIPPELANTLPKLTEDSFPGMLVNVISGRIANRLGLGGVNYAVTSACASSLTAIELAVKELRAHTSEMVLAGGADFHNGINDYLMFSSVGALSAKGRCRSFDNEADGIALGEGVGVVVLKRLADAKRDGDRIYAVIDGIAGSSDGKGLGLTAPRKEGQKRSLERAYWQAGILPADIGLVEAHGTGTVVGDRTELQTLTEVYSAGGALAGQAGLGSVKSQIGHTKCAAGVAGLIKIAKALHHRVLPGTQSITSPNDWYQPSSSPFNLNSQARPWLAPSHTAARAAVSAFGFGGANFHAVLSAWPAHQSVYGALRFPAELFAVRGHSLADATNTLGRLSTLITASSSALYLRDLAVTLWEAGSGPVQLAFVAGSLEQLQSKISGALTQSRDQGISYRDANAANGKLAYLFSGQGSQYPGMLRELFVYFPELQDILAVGAEHVPILYPNTAYDDATHAEQQRKLTDTRQAQPALGLVEYAAFRWLSNFGLKPDMAAGHSYGELAALATAGAFDVETLIKLSQARANAMVSVECNDPGKMAAVSLDATALEHLLTDFSTVVLANQNSPTQTVISGPSPDVLSAMAHLKAHGVACRQIETACAFHSPQMIGASQRYADVLENYEIGELQWPVYSNLTAAPYDSAAVNIRTTLSAHISHPVRFVAEIERMYADGARVFLEIGPRTVLTRLVGRILKDKPHTTIAIDHDHKGLKGLFESLAQLATLLPDFDASALYKGRATVIDLDQPQVLSASTWMVNGGRAWPLKGKAPAHAGVVTLNPVIQVAAGSVVQHAVAQVSSTPNADEQAIVSYLNNMRDMVHAQRDVLLGFFGAPTTVRAPAPSPTLAVPVLPTVTAPIEVVAPSSAMPSSQDHRSILLALVSDRTGYPSEMLDLDLDLEADLSIDSIKRLEIIGELSQKLSLRSALGTGADALLEQLATQKTLRAVLDWLKQHLPDAQVPTDRATETTAAPAVKTPQPVAEILLAIVSDCTGYPVEALDLDLDLEADLSIDSIKRLEIVGQLLNQLNAAGGADRDAMLDHLAACKTLKAMLDWLQDSHQSTNQPTTNALVKENAADAIPFERYILRSQTIEPQKSATLNLSGLRFLMTNDGLGIATLLVPRLEQLGARVQLVDFTNGVELIPELTEIDGLIHLWSINPQSQIDDIKRFFTATRTALLHKMRHLLVLTGLGGDFSATSPDYVRGGGMAGMIKSLSREFTELRAHWVDVDTHEAPDILAGYIESELHSADALPEVAWRQGHRRQLNILHSELDPASIANLPLNRESVVLLTGGARGITALVAVELARRYQCHVELVGRSAPPQDVESEATRGISDQRLLRQALLAEDKTRKPAEVERLARRLLADRDFRATLAAVRAAGSTVNYTALDVRDDQIFSDFITSIYHQRGRIDGVIHGAGVVEDKLVRDKSDESFSRVFDTKVKGAVILSQHIRKDVGFVVFFSSVASAFGNRGQVDYATANDVLDKLAHHWQSQIDGRVLSVNWGPWADTGMVSESLKNEYARKGIGLIPQQQGVAALLAELGSQSIETQIVLMSGRPESFAGETRKAKLVEI
ncbi:type I polyketide synthase [Aquirhabdus parva]|uniref:SDR family NAD(P)-dependent oxidoreductase n=1 Tax=Aquirhabdus parva TaxID=2283318 RepID=A0A345P381_9GAMM|nr:type I polyketide synthase [Aquirhabdus parva]AXI01740.1 SDR family NAD(P)-dependent oxidoreductase [Aquirhabdus parva]